MVLFGVPEMSFKNYEEFTLSVLIRQKDPPPNYTHIYLGQDEVTLKRDCNRSCDALGSSKALFSRFLQSGRTTLWCLIQ